MPWIHRGLWKCAYLTLHHSQGLRLCPSLSDLAPRPTAEDYNVHGLSASRLRPNTTSAACAGTLIPRFAGITRSTLHGPCCGSQRTITQMTTRWPSWHFPPTVKTKAGAEAGRRGARRQNQIPRDNTNTRRLHRRKFAPLRVGW
jgi:hypothetical protein